MAIRGSRRWRQGVLLGLVVTALAVVAPPPAMAGGASGSIALASGTEPVLIGDSITLTGVFPTGGDRRFVIQKARPRSSHWHTIKRSRGTTSSGGDYQATVKVTGTRKYRAVIRRTSTQSRQVSSHLKVRATPGWRQVSTGLYDTCAIWDNHSLWCWGNNRYGELGNTFRNGVDMNDPYPSQILVGDSGPEKWLAVASGDHHACAIRTDQTLWCWGLNGSGQLGSSANYTTTAANPTPSQVLIGDAGPETWTSATAGAGFTCAIRTDQSLWCWGSNYYGQLGTGADSTTLASSPTPLPVAGSATWLSVAAGRSHACGVQSDSTLWCWGYNYSGQTASTTVGLSDPAPVEVGSGSPATWIAVAGGDTHTCGIQSDSTVWCWGVNFDGQFGNGTNTTNSSGTTTPTPMSTGSGPAWSAIAAGGNHTCGLQDDASLWCWGYGWYGQLGYGGTDNSDSPAQVSLGTTWTSVSASQNYTCALRSDHSLWCWGVNNLGQLGNYINSGDYLANPTPLEVADPAP